MSMICPAQGCGRMLDNEATLIQHFKRRHPNQQLPPQYLSRSIGGQKKQESILLPKISTKKSISRDKKEREKVSEEHSKTVTNMEVNEIITASRKTVIVGEGRKLRLNTATSSVSLLNNNKSIEISKPTTTLVEEKKREERKPSLRKQQVNVESAQKLKLRQNQREFEIRKQKQAQQQKQREKQILKEKQGLKQKQKEQQKQKQKIGVLKRKLSLRKEKEPLPIKRTLNQHPEISKYTSTQSVIGASAPISLTGQKKVLLRPKSMERKSTQANKDKQSTVAEPVRVSTADVKPTQTIKVQLPTLIIKVPTKVFKPSYYTIEILYLNNVGLQKLSLEGLQFLYELSVEGNNLTSLDFLNYQDNQNLGVVNAAFNKISSIYLPSNIQTLNLANNSIQKFQDVTSLLALNSSLKTLCLTDNPVSSIYNFKFQILLSAKKLTELNSSRVLSKDIDVAIEYKAIIDRKPMNKTKSSVYYQRFNQNKFSMTSTTGFQSVSLIFKQEDNIRLEKELLDINSKIKQVKKGLAIIELQNQTLREDISMIKTEDVDYDELENQYRERQIEMETLELMNILKYSTKEELSEMIQEMKQKMIEIGCL